MMEDVVHGDPDAGISRRGTRSLVLGGGEKPLTFAHAAAGAPSAAAHFGAIFGEVGAACGQAAAEAWTEDTELRNAAGGEPEMTVLLGVASGLHAAAACMGGALE